MMPMTKMTKKKATKMKEKEADEEATKLIRLMTAQINRVNRKKERWRHYDQSKYIKRNYF